MRITAVDQPKNTRNTLSIESMSRHAVHALLTNLKIGSLTLEEGGQLLTFGDREDKRVSARIRVENGAAFSSVLRDGSTGAGEAYMLSLIHI